MVASKRMDRIVSAIEKKCLDEGLVIEAGYAGLELLLWDNPDSVGQRQRSEMRKAFFAGAQHLYSTMMRALDPGEEPTDDDLRRMENVHDELERFRVTLEAEAAQNQRTRGTA